MKKYVLIMMILFSVSVFSQNNSEKLKAFNSSITEEESYNYKNALEPLLEIYNNHKNDYLINLRIGWLYYQKKDYENSIQYYRKALKISGNSTEALLGITLPYSAAGNWDEIESIYKLILDKDPGNYTANLNLGQLFFNGKNYLNAKIYLEKVNKEYPGDFSSALYLGWTYYYLGNKSRANKLFVDALILQPGNESAIEGMNLTQ